MIFGTILLTEVAMIVMLMVCFEAALLLLAYLVLVWPLLKLCRICIAAMRK